MFFFRCVRKSEGVRWGLGQFAATQRFLVVAGLQNGNYGWFCLLDSVSEGEEVSVQGIRAVNCRVAVGVRIFGKEFSTSHASTLLAYWLVSTNKLDNNHY